MRFSESLTQFLLSQGQPSRHGQGNFRLGDWVTTLDDTRLEHLQKLAGEANRGQNLSAPWIEDLLFVVLQALAAERGIWTLPLRPETLPTPGLEHFGVLYLAASLERLQRFGLLKLKRPISMDPMGEIEMDGNSHFIAHGPEILERLKRGFH